MNATTRNIALSVIGWLICAASAAGFVFFFNAALHATTYHARTLHFAGFAGSMLLCCVSAFTAVCVADSRA